MSRSKDIAILILDVQKNFEHENLWRTAVKYFETWLFFSLRSVRFQRYSTLAWTKSFVLMLELTRCAACLNPFSVVRSITLTTGSGKDCGCNYCNVTLEVYGNKGTQCKTRDLGESPGNDFEEGRN